MKPKSVVFRIRRKYFDQITAREQDIEYRVDSPHWEKTLTDLPIPAIAVFVCGHDVYRCWIPSKPEKVKTPETFSDQGKKDVPTSMCWAIPLGEPTPDAVTSSKDKGQRKRRRIDVALGRRRKTDSRPFTADDIRNEIRSRSFRNAPSTHQISHHLRVLASRGEIFKLEEKEARKYTEWSNAYRFKEEE